MKNYVLYHAGCMDGFGAAWAAWLGLGDSAEYLPVSYGRPLPEIEDGSNVLILDFSYPRGVLDELRQRVASLLVIDHHSTAKQDLEGLTYAKFDTSKSGAVLTWQHFWPEKKVPKLLLYIQDRDLWQWRMQRSMDVNAGLALYEREFATWSILAKEIPMLCEEGLVALRHVGMLARGMARQAWFADIAGYSVPMVNATVLQSEVGAAMLEQYPEALFVAVFRDEEDRRVWSLRSRPGFDCTVIAKKYDGGGHPQACGFEIPFREDEPWTYASKA